MAHCLGHTHTLSGMPLSGLDLARVHTHKHTHTNAHTYTASPNLPLFLSNTAYNFMKAISASQTVFYILSATQRVFNIPIFMTSHTPHTAPTGKQKTGSAARS